MKKLLFLFALLLLLGTGCQKPMGAIPDELKLKVSKSKIIGSKKSEKEVRYAYKYARLNDEPDDTVKSEASKKGLIITGEDVSKRGSNVRIFNTNDENKKIAQFVSSDPKYYKDPNGDWWIAAYATTTPEVFEDSGLINIAHADTGLFYPAAGANSPVDGHFECDGVSWAACYTASSEEVFNDGVVLRAVSYSNADWRIYRAIMTYDLSSIAGATVSSVAFHGYVTSVTNTDNDGNDFIRITSSTPASTAALVNDDFDQIGVTAFASDIDLTGLATSATSTWTFNATGITFTQTAVDGDGMLKLGMREGHDILNNTISAPGNNQINISSADETGNHPDVTIVYTPAVVATSKIDDGLLLFE